ncbi:5'/3'-nucleotidase SurE [filamentous cyanobacterium LEGE 11480]|uniref:5'-nucleotidase n=1 Tax=Romeriopsis navalis LEGE 11480 TaxID=2777977 RepID=A0A928Z0X7_9CYAN|nr:5'/3'-nucleotidase SurE [Romeriopsis navalis]MBE9028741.1 5'/3'-nucleotidase SurE [Romeriopsis navalis LEGE 11480]
MIILTNDDGIGAPGIVALEAAIGQALATQSDIAANDVAIVAPAEQQSGCGHQVTTFAPIGLEQSQEYAWAVSGTPADCTRVALWHLYPEQVQWVLSGINAGGNMGSDVYISGTVAAVREAALHRIPAIAFSHYRQDKQAFNWDKASEWTTQLLLDLMARPYEPGTYWNINLPHLAPDAPNPEIVFCQPCTQPLPVGFQVDGSQLTYAAKYGDRCRDGGSDVETCLGGKIAVTQLRV